MRIEKSNDFWDTINVKCCDIRELLNNYILELGLISRKHEYFDQELILSNININRLNNNPVIIDRNKAETIITLLNK